MVVATVALIGAFISAYLLLYKLGAFGTIACGDGACETVQNSPWAYLFGVPVAAWGLAGYVGILVVAVLGTLPRFMDERWVSWGLLILTAGAFGFSVYLSVIEEFVIHAWCRWCIASAVAATLAFGFSLPEIGTLRAERT